MGQIQSVQPFKAFHNNIKNIGNDDKEQQQITLQTKKLRRCQNLCGNNLTFDPRYNIRSIALKIRFKVSIVFLMLFNCVDKEILIPNLIFYIHLNKTRKNRSRKYLIKYQTSIEKKLIF